MVVAAVGATAVAGAVTGAMSANASKNAANAQAQSARDASQMQWDAFQQAQANQKPYMDLGTNNIGNLQNALNDPRLNQSFSFDASNLQNTPGYQFALQQGLKSQQNQAAARGLGYSGAQIKGAQSYATGLADQTYNQQYQNALQQFNTNQNVAAQQYNRYSGLVSLGQNAAAGVGNQGIQTAATRGNDIMQAGNAQAAGIIGQQNGYNSAINSVGNAFGSYAGFGGGGGSNSLYGNSYNGFNNPSNYG